jgi:hypothetical protein
MNKNTMNLKNFKNQKDIQILSISSSIAIKGGDDKRPVRPGGGTVPPIVPNSTSGEYNGYETSAF